MTWTAPEPQRAEPDTVASERRAYEQWLDYHRATLLNKCAGLTAEQLKIAAAEPSNLTLLGLVRHMSEVERSWFRRRLDSQDIEMIYCSDDDLDGDFDNVADADAQAAFEVFREECRAATEVAARYELDDTFVRRGETYDLRWAYIHMIEEYARHNGHADLLRERIDGVTGD